MDRRTEDHWHRMEQKELEERLGIDCTVGLSMSEAEKRLANFGRNELQEKVKETLFQKFLNQFNNFLVIILIVASVFSIGIGEITDSVVIMAIVILNAVLGVFQENKAENALAALKKMAAPNAKVVRDGNLVSLPSWKLVPGDVVLFEAGDYLPADVRIIEAVNLRIEESSLTGESVPTEKRSMTIDEEVVVADRHNMGYMGTVAAYGRGRGVVVETGMRTEIGHLAQMIDTYEEERTPLQEKLQAFSKKLGLICLVICALIFVIGMYEGYLKGALEWKDIQLLMMTAVSLAVAAIPEGLPAIVTLVLALGMQRMIRKNVIIKKLHAVETLGSTTVICSDKTGTLTQNKMMVTCVHVPGKRVDVSGEGYRPEGKFTMAGEIIDPVRDKSLGMLLLGAALCNDAVLKFEDQSKECTIVGDPTEGALLVAAAKAGIITEQMRDRYPRIQEIPFDSERKLMTTFHRNHSGNIVAYVKGAPDVLAARAAYILSGESVRELSEEDMDMIRTANSEMTSQALRVLAVGYREFEGMPADIGSDAIERDLVFVGMLGMIDPPRREARESIEMCRTAGIRPIMITGDHPATAYAIARNIGLATSDKQMLSGHQLDRMPPEDLQGAVKQVNVFARVSPVNKVAIVDALRADGEITAMTGDGVNDAPALKKAHIGVAMGKTGTDVTRETADMVLTDDNFASIVAAVEEGRVIYSNLRKTIFFLVSCNIAEIMIIFIAMLLGWPIPLLPIHLLWLNLVTDSFPAFALGLENKEPDIMKQPPRDPNEPLLSKNIPWLIAVQSIVETLAVLSAFRIADHFWGLEMARTVAFATLTLSELYRSYPARSEFFSVFTLGLFSNRYLNYGVAASLLLLLLSIYTPLSSLLKTVGLWGSPLQLVLGFAALPFIAAETAKWVIRISTPQQTTSAQIDD